MQTRAAGRYAFLGVLTALTGLGAASCGAAKGTVGDSATDASASTGTVKLTSGDGAASSTCTPGTCADRGYDCGQNTDGCGNLIDCGSCSAPDFCGGGGYSRCGTSSSWEQEAGLVEAGSACVPKTCADLGFDCGYAGDGCGGMLDCGGSSACTAPEFCGGGGPQQCGGNLNVAADGAVDTACTPTTCADLGYDCGYAGDGCGNQLDCGGASACTLPQYCGGGGANQCGGSVYAAADGGAVDLCTPKTCAELGYNCGQAGDGCGNVLSCGTCSGTQYCGGGGPNQCGGSVYTAADGGTVNLCTPKTCSTLGYDCGPAGDGCGNVLNCGTCSGTQYCGGGGPSQCGGNVYVGADGGAVNLCTSKTCAELGYNCGPAADGCGNLLQCGSCTGADTCGGGGTPGMCGHTCTGLCQYQASCTSGTPTTITGRVLAGASAWTGLTPDPVPNVLVYVPNATVEPLAQGYTAGSCPECGSDVSGSPLVSTYTNYDGTFTLTNVPSPPSGQTLPLVIQLGRWRRQFQITPPSACAATSIGDLNLPRNHTEGDIPLTAVSTGSVDALECVLMKMGVAESEFTSSTAATTGRIQIYAKGPGTLLTGGGGPGAYIQSTTTPHTVTSQPESALMATGGTYMNYDQILLPCWGAAVGFNPTQTNNMRSTDEPGNLVTYADSGGHFFATHFSYTWLVNNGEFNEVAAWNPNENNPGTVTWTLNVSKVPPVVSAPMHSGIFWQWLNLMGALSNANTTTPPTDPEVAIADPRHDVDGVANGSVDWIDGTDPDLKNAMVEHFTFNTPVTQTNQCGHAIFSDFHVSDVTNANSTAFPNECTKTFTAQERILEYMLFDLASCVSPPQSSCQPMSCASQNLSCGPAGDGCGNEIQCGTCASPATCGGAGIPGQCGEPDGGACVPRTCTQQGLACGPAGDGCGNEIQCGTCASPATCGGGGVTGQCGEPDGGACTPKSCALQGFACGPAGDGCGNIIQCGSCPAGETCGGGGSPGRCGAPDAGACSPETCASQNIGCGPAGDGCGNAIDCGRCLEGQTCGGAGVPGQCGAPDSGTCLPETCASQNIGCGPAGDGCGNSLQCGACTAPQTCGGGGVSGQCGGGACTPLTCADLGDSCGPAGDGCGGLLDCGSCASPQTCGGGGQAGQCGAPSMAR